MSVDLLVKLRDAHQMAADALNDEIEKKAPVEVKHDSKDFDKLAYTEKQGSKGPYYQTSKEANNNSQLFQDLQKIVKDHKGFCQFGNFKYWFDRSNEDIIDRRAK